MPKIGPIVFDLKGFELDAEEREILQHPLIGGVIFFARNYESPEQINQLATEIRKAKKTPILLCVDQEGGRVQRFRNGFTRLPPVGQLGLLYDNSPNEALRLTKICGWLMAAEVLAVNVDISFAPVLDLELGINPAITSRAFHHDPETAIKLAKTYTLGMREAGMAAVGKHYPGHGSVRVDSHLDLPVDLRSMEEVSAKDLIPFAKMITAGMEGIMAAHILFSAIDPMPAGFSKYWLQDVLRKQLHFNGMIFSDDLIMQGADVIGDFPDRARIALEAGCDMALICNHRDNLVKTIEGLPNDFKLINAEKFATVQGNFDRNPKPLKDSNQWQDTYNTFAELTEQHQLIV
jgi:beta-N-acetylhexosaminidase